MTKQERINEINKLMKELAEEKKQLLKEIESEKVEVVNEVKSLEDMSVEELRQYAKSNSMKLTSKLKAKMIQQIREYEKYRNTHGNIFRAYESNRYFV